jgi:vitamin-K-epoxide reductase (warfarin-sensitive)
MQEGEPGVRMHEKRGIHQRGSRKMESMKYLIALLAVAGMAISAMALHVHLMDPNAAPPCAVSEHWDCGVVGHSRYSWFPPKTFDEKPGALHIPVAAVGIAGYAVIAIFALMGRLRIVLELARIGFFCAAFLSYIEAYVIQMWCIYCVWSQAIIAALLVASVVAVVMRQRRRAASMRTVLAEHVD